MELELDLTGLGTNLGQIDPYNCPQTDPTGSLWMHGSKCQWDETRVMYLLGWHDKEIGPREPYYIALPLSLFNPLPIRLAIIAIDRDPAVATQTIINRLRECERIDAANNNDWPASVRESYLANIIYGNIRIGS